MIENHIWLNMNFKYYVTKYKLFSKMTQTIQKISSNNESQTFSNSSNTGNKIKMDESIIKYARNCSKGVV